LRAKDYGISYKNAGCRRKISTSQLKRHANDQQTTPGNTRENNSVSRCQDDIDSNKILPLRRTNCYASDYVSLLLMRLLPCSQTDGTSQRQTPRTLSRTPITPDTPDSLELGIHEVSSDNDDEPKKTRGSTPWSIQEHPTKKTR